MWTHFNCKSDYNFLNSTIDCEKIAKISKKRGYGAACLMDYKVASGFVEFVEACKEEKIKPILGIQLDNYSVIIRNKIGCQQIFRIVSKLNTSIKIEQDEFNNLKNNCYIISGYPESDLYGMALLGRTEAEECVDNYIKNFGDSFKIAIHLTSESSLEDLEVADLLRKIASDKKIKCIAWRHSRYAEPEDATDLRVLLCSSLGATLPGVMKKMTPEVKPFFERDDYYMPTLEEINDIYPANEIENCNELNNGCDSYSLDHSPMLPLFDKNVDAYEAITERAREGWKRLLNWDKDSENYKKYGERIKYELSVIKENNLSNYFLIVADICDYVRGRGIFTAPGRGSGAGCLISYLLGITNIDPIPYGLLFERFFNPARKNALPDIDLDFPPSYREEIIKYITDKYGSDRVYKIATFGRLQGKAILKEVLRVHEACDFTTMNEITKFVPDESKISGDLQELSEENEEYAKILYWTLLHNAKELSPWVKLEKDGSISGEFGRYFEQAIKLEGLYKQLGEHASGVIVAPDNIENYCPVIKSSKGKSLAGMSFPHLEKLGLCKIDILGVSAYDKIAMIINAMETGDIYRDSGLSEYQKQIDSQTNVATV